MSHEKASHWLLKVPNLRTIQQLAVIHSHASHPTDELEVWEVILITEARVWIDLKGVVISADRQMGDFKWMNYDASSAVCSNECQWERSNKITDQLCNTVIALCLSEQQYSTDKQINR